MELLKFAVIAAKEDAAGLNIKSQLLSGYGFAPCEEVFDSEQVYFLKSEAKKSDNSR